MTALRRTTTPSALPLLRLDLDCICDLCGKTRNKGSHRRCSKQRQAMNRHRWEK